MKSTKKSIARLSPGARIETVRIADGQALFVECHESGERVVFGDIRHPLHRCIRDLAYVNGQVAYRAFDADSQHIVWGDVEDRPHREIYDIDFSTGRRFYRAKYLDRSFYVYDGREGPVYDSVAECWLDGPGNDIPTGSARVGSRWHVFYGDWKSREYDFVWDPILFQGSLLFAARIYDGMRIVWGSHQDPLFHSVANLCVTSDHYAYLATNGSITSVMQDGAHVHQADEARWLRFSDGSVPCFASRRGAHWHAVLGRHVDEPVDELFSLQVSQSGELLYSARVGSANFVRHGPWTSAQYDEVGIPLFRNGHLVFDAVRARAPYIVVDGEEIPAKGWMRNTDILSDGRMVGVERVGDRDRIVCGTKRGRLFHSVEHPVNFRNRIHYAAYDGKVWTVVSNRARGRAFAGLSQLRVVRDHLLYIGEETDGTGRVRLIADGHIGEAFDRIFDVRLADRVLSYYGIRHLALYEVTVPL
jgi:hypothetical protein